MTARESEIISLIRKEVKPALGCTEPIAVALAVAKAMEIIEEKCNKCGTDWRFSDDYQLRIEVSGNILKNGMGVGIPGTGMVGLHIAAALGAVCGHSSYGLEVLHDLDEASIAQAKALVEAGKVTIGLAETDLKLYVKAVVACGCGHEACAIIQDDHDKIVETSFDDNVLTSLGSGNAEAADASEQKSTLESAKIALATIKPVLEAIENWTETEIHDRVMEAIPATGMKNGQILWPLRIAISGKMSTPGGAFEIAYLLGREETMKRLNASIAQLEA